MAIPVPPRPSGFMLGDLSAAVRIDAFVDIQCPHSRVAWPTLVELANHYRGRSVSIAVHLITLSNHRQSWDISLGMFIVAEDDAQRFWDFATYLFDRQSDFYNAEFRHKTHDDLRNLVADYANEFAGLDRVAVLQGLDSDRIYEAGRTPIRYAATRAVWGTPTFFINNADNVPVNHRSSLNDWVVTIDELLRDD